MSVVTPLIHKDGQHLPAPAGSVLDPDLLPLSADSGNQIGKGSDGGLFVPPADATKPDDLVSAVSGNELSVAADGRLYAHTDPASLISATDGNRLEAGLDGKLNVPPTDPVAPADLISTDADNAVRQGADGRLYVPETATAPASLISSDAGNIITEGGDGRLFARSVSADADNLVQRGADYGAKLTASDLVSAGTVDNVLSVNDTDKRLQVRLSDVTDAVKRDLTIVSDDSGNLLKKGSDKGAYLDEHALPDQVKAGVATSVTDGQVSVNYGHGLTVQGNALQVDEHALDLDQVSVGLTEKILSLSSDLVLSATVAMGYNLSTGYLTLYGKNDAVLDTVYIPGAVSALQSVDIVVNPDADHQGTYFAYTYTTVSGTVVRYVPVPAGSAVAAGDGVNVETATVGTTSVSTVSVKAASDGGLTVGAGGVAVDFDKVATRSGLDDLADQVSGLADRTGALETDMAGVRSDVTDLKDAVAGLESLSSITISDTKPDVSALRDGEGVVYPAEDLLI